MGKLIILDTMVAAHHQMQNRIWYDKFESNAVIEPEERKKWIGNKGKYFKQLHIINCQK